MNKGLENLKKKAKNHPFYKLNVEDRVKKVSEEFENYDDSKAPYEFRRKALSRMRGENW